MITSALWRCSVINTQHNRETGGAYADDGDDGVPYLRPCTVIDAIFGVKFGHFH